ncbi:MAG TPA: hypothetical protein VMI56_08330 [Reyranella sp.]|nr:hypothetical protein [Reyranella sp.]
MSLTTPALAPVVAPLPNTARGEKGMRVGAFVLALVVVAFAYAARSPQTFLGLHPLTAWLIELGLVFILFVTIGRGFNLYWFGILVDGRNKIALSRLQVVLWSILFIGTFPVIYFWNMAHAPDLAQALDLTVPDAVWALMGMAGASAAATPLILSAKPDPSADNPAIPPQDPDKMLDGIVVKRRSDCRPLWSDVVMGDESGNADVIDISKVQQLLLTAVAVAVYGGAIGKTLLLADRTSSMISALPGMTSGFLLLIAASHATYLGYKAASHSN